MFFYIFLKPWTPSKAAAPAKKETAVTQPEPFALSHGSELLPETVETYFEANASLRALGSAAVWIGCCKRWHLFKA